MKYTVSVITGKGRGKGLGFPTLNFTIPENLQEPDGIYAGWVYVNAKKYKGAFHLGPIPTFQDQDRSFEVFVLDTSFQTTPEKVEVELLKKIRDIQNFASADELSAQIEKDVKKIQVILGE